MKGISIMKSYRIAKRAVAVFGASLLFATQLLASSAVNINTASAEEIAAALDGIGGAKAQAIIDYRDSNGDFKLPADIMKVSGIGEATFAKIKPYVLIIGRASDDKAAANSATASGASSATGTATLATSSN